MKVWNRYIKDEWIILVPIIVVTMILANYFLEQGNLFWSDLFFYINIAAFVLLILCITIRIYYSFKNLIE